MGVLRQADPRCGLADEMVEGAIPKPSVPALPLLPQPAVLAMASTMIAAMFARLTSTSLKMRDAA